MSNDIGTERVPITTQKTSKLIKVTILFGLFLMVGSCSMAVAGADGDNPEAAGYWIFLSVVGFFVFLFGKAFKWWKHS